SRVHRRRLVEQLQGVDVHARATAGVDGVLHMPPAGQLDLVSRDVELGIAAPDEPNLRAGDAGQPSHRRALLPGPTRVGQGLQRRSIRALHRDAMRGDDGDGAMPERDLADRRTSVERRGHLALDADLLWPALDAERDAAQRAWGEGHATGTARTPIASTPRAVGESAEVNHVVLVAHRERRHGFAVVAWQLRRTIGPEIPLVGDMERITRRALPRL